jgi:hypothetical protein
MTTTKTQRQTGRARVRSLNSKPSRKRNDGPPPPPPKEESGDDEPYSHPFDAYWLGCYSGPLGMEQIDACDAVGWMNELSAWARSNGWYICKAMPHNFLIGKIDPATKEKIDLPRRDFFRIVAKFKAMNEKYGFCLTGMLIYDTAPTADPTRRLVERFLRGRHTDGDTIGRPLRALPEARKKVRKIS